MTGKVAQKLFAAAARWPDRPFLNVLPETAEAYGITPGEITYTQIVEAVWALCDRLAAAGVAAGMRVAVCLENRPCMLEHLFALNALGASFVPINPDLRRAELAAIDAHAEPALVVTTPARVAMFEAACACPVTASDMQLPEVAPRGEPAQGEAALLYTSGSTGGPKGCVLSDTYFLEAGRWYAAAGGLCALQDGERMLTPLPLFHMNALAYSVMAMLEVGGSVTVLDRFHPRSWWESVQAARASAIHYLGVMPAILMRAPPSPNDTRHAVRFGFGANVEPQLHAAFEARFGFPLIEAWAMTETGAGACIAANRPPRTVGAKAIGRPGPELDIMLAGDDGTDAGDGPGELLVRRKGSDPRFGFFSRYLKDDAATKAAWAGGWFHTGDVVRREGEDLIFVDRKKNVIRRSGENIAAIEVEAVLLAHDGVAGAAVAAVPDAIRDEEVFALVVPRGGAGDAKIAEAIVDHCVRELAYYKAPGYVAFVTDIPLTATQKPARPAIKALAAERFGSGAFHDCRARKSRR